MLVGEEGRWKSVTSEVDQPARIWFLPWDDVAIEGSCLHHVKTLERGNVRNAGANASSLERMQRDQGQTSCAS